MRLKSARKTPHSLLCSSPPRRPRPFQASHRTKARVSVVPVSHLRASLHAHAPMTADRATTFKASLGALNAQFAAWVAGQAASAPHDLWAGGARDYVKHAAGLVEEYKDVLGGGGKKREKRSADASEGARALLVASHALLSFTHSIDRRAS